MTADDGERELVRALLENPQEIRARLQPDDAADFDALMRALASSGDPRETAGVLRRLLDLIDECLPGERDILRHRYAEAPSTADPRLERNLRLLLGGDEADDAPAGGADGAASGGEASSSETGSGETGGERRRAELPPLPRPSAAELWRRAVSRLLGAPAIEAAELSERYHQDPDRPDLLRLRRDDGAVQLPAFQFDDDGAPRAIVLAVNRLLDADGDPWGVADWWLGPHNWLPAPPAECLGLIDDEQLLAAARVVVEGA